MAAKMKVLRLIPVVLSVVLFASCRDSASSAEVLEGNMFFARGQYQKSILKYLGAGGSGNTGKDVISYNLANVYYALGEGDAALRLWAVAENETDNSDILFRVAFNRGVLYYHWGRYDEAYRAFRRALTIRPQDIEAKINLEDSLSRIPSAVPRESPAGDTQIDSNTEDSRHLLDYIKRKEADTWLTRSETAGGSTEDW
jgi:Ca-activated chloride channel family protein